MLKKNFFILNIDNDIFFCRRLLFGFSGGLFGFFGRGRLGDFEIKIYCKYIFVLKKSYVYD